MRRTADIGPLRGDSPTRTARWFCNPCPIVNTTCRLLGFLAAMACPTAPIIAASLSDPWGELDRIPSVQDSGRVCPTAVSAQPLALSDVIDSALCRNPRTATSWAAARSRAAAVGRARAAYLPQLDASGSLRRDLSGDGGTDVSSAGSNGDTRYAASVSLSYLLFDFGERRAALDTARALLETARLTRNAVLQAVYSDAVSAYQGWVAADGTLSSARESERAAQSSLDAATAREHAGTATRADRLQAQTALAQTQLARVQAQGGLRTALGTLANVMGLPANADLRLGRPPLVEPSADFHAPLDSLVATALHARPDLAASQASLDAALAEVRIARSASRPKLSATATQSHSESGSRESDSGAVGLSLELPLFGGLDTTYRVLAAEAQVDARRAEREQLANQVSLEVYQAHTELATQTQSVFTAQALMRAADESEIVARQRYEAGVGTIIDLINAQGSAADARRQLIQARSDWSVARTQLAQAIGILDPASDPDQPDDSNERRR